MRIGPVSSLVMISLLAAGQAASARDDAVFDKTVAADARGIVEVSNFSGKVDVSAWDRPEVSVHAAGSVQGIEVKSDRGRTSITVRPPGMSFGTGPNVNLTVKIPALSELDVSGVSADVVSRDVMGGQRLKSVSGSIVADATQGDVEAKTVSGNITLHGRGKPAGMHVSTISGSVRLDHGAGDIEATSVSGDLKMELDPGRDVRMRTTSGDVSVQGRLAKDADFDIQTVSGEVKVHAAPEGGFEYEVSTFSGSLRNCFNAQSERTSKYGSGERLSGSLGPGGARVRVKTMSGDVDLCNHP
ncbi:MAG TPA: DUF4097 family beta strand repeat-containing protein [Steroidobacteraceae bacterium]|nr:DUF4097 family beta strand repeat-containing protein [Steroidobacteraceae bacterium]